MKNRCKVLTEHDTFPGYFKRRPNRAAIALSRSPKVAKVWKPFNFSVFLLHKNSDMTPTAEQDLQHMQAGLGKRCLSMGIDMTHPEVSNLFESAFPKMKTITGGWLLYKAVGGNGRRHLSIVPPESEGYTGNTIRTASGGGKTMLFIVPLQEEFDLAPLSCNAQEFSLMPKAECKNCSKMMPLQILALHVAQCEEFDFDSDSETEVKKCVLDTCVTASYEESISTLSTFLKIQHKDRAQHKESTQHKDPAQHKDSAQHKESAQHKDSALYVGPALHQTRPFLHGSDPKLPPQNHQTLPPRNHQTLRSLWPSHLAPGEVTNVFTYRLSPKRQSGVLPLSARSPVTAWCLTYQPRCPWVWRPSVIVYNRFIRAITLFYIIKYI
ncbi:hypothetical protein N1851_020129 [Merluccius polli]|uniref:Uncharacterized protein n=1 Tax=Merluccius polli TaxID=89951 RepID=A0AA47P039_MERPO|nr:hypothetical protein N1851_020129 [Merluccius polli]